MRSLSSAIRTSGLPVSVACVRYASTTDCFCSLANTNLLHSCLSRFRNEFENNTAQCKVASSPVWTKFPVPGSQFSADHSLLSVDDSEFFRELRTENSNRGYTRITLETNEGCGNLLVYSSGLFQGQKQANPTDASCSRP